MSYPFQSEAEAHLLARDKADRNIHLVPINPAAFGYCEGWVLLLDDGGKTICVQVFGQHQYSEAVAAADRERRFVAAAT